MNTQTHHMLRNLENLGFSFDEARQLRRISMTFHAWDEAECGDSNNYASFSIERDEETNKPYRCVYPHANNEVKRYAIPDRETGAQRRLDKIIGDRNNRYNQTNGDPGGHVRAYHQSDCRGASLYIVLESDLNGSDIHANYTKGVAVYR